MNKQPLTKQEQTLQKKFANYFTSGTCLPFAKGRVALYAGIKALNIPEGSEIIMPGYTCVVVPTAVMFAGYKPVYVDIDPNTYNIDTDQLTNRITERTGAIIVQHTYGIPAELDTITQYCTQHNIPLIEDCCHSFASRYRDKLCGTFGSFAFFSGQWNKFFSTGLGGFFYTQEPELAERMLKLFQNAQKPSSLASLRFALQILAYQFLVKPSTTALMTGLYRLLGRAGIVAGSSSYEELEGTLPKGYFSRMAPVQLKKSLSELEKVQQTIEHRRQIGEFYHQELPRLNFKTVPESSKTATVFLRYPVRVGNKEALLKKAQKQGIELGSWFETPLHGNEAPLSVFAYETGSCPNAERACEQVVNLPTHIGVDKAYAEKVLNLLREYAEI